MDLRMRHESSGSMSFLNHTSSMRPCARGPFESRSMCSGVDRSDTSLELGRGLVQTQ
jgi:hypothetical protein